MGSTSVLCPTTNHPRIQPTSLWKVRNVSVQQSERTACLFSHLYNYVLYCMPIPHSQWQTGRRRRRQCLYSSCRWPCSSPCGGNCGVSDHWIVLLEVSMCVYIHVHTSLLNQHGVYVSQLIRMSRICHTYSSFVQRHRLPTKKLIKQGFWYTKLCIIFKSLPKDIMYCSVSMTLE